MMLSVACAMAVISALVAAGPVGAGPRYQIAYSTYLGGSDSEQAREVIPMADGSAYVGGQTYSADFPVTPGAYQKRYGGEPGGTGNTGIFQGDCFIVHISPDGGRLIASTYFGGSMQERNTYGMSLDAEGNVAITTSTRSSNLPTTPGAWRRTYAGGSAADGHDGATAKLSADLTRLLWCTYLGGCWPRGGHAQDAQGNLYIVGSTGNPAFPAAEGASQPERAGRRTLVLKLKADGSGIVWSTLYGGSTSTSEETMGARLDAAGNVYVTGHTQATDFPVTPGAAQGKLGGKSDAFAAKLSADGGRLLYGTYIGGAENEFSEHCLCLLPDGSVLTTGVSSSPDFPTTPGAFQRTLKGKNDGFLVKVSPDGSRFVFSTLLGGSGGEFLLMPTPDASGNILLVGQTSSPDFPVTPDALQTKYGGSNDGVLAVLSADGSQLLYATYLGGEGDDLVRSLALGPAGEVYLVGNTTSADFPVSAGALITKLPGRSSAFVTKLIPAR